MIELHTQRLLMRTPTLDDAEAIVAFCDDPESSWGGYGIPSPYTLEKAREWVTKTGADADEEKKYAFLLVRKDTSAIVGDVMLNRDPTHNIGDIGYIVGKDHRGHGFAFEAATELLRFAFESVGLHRVYATCWARNERSAHILEKLGFTREGVLREQALKWGQYEDDVYYGLLRREWVEQNS